MLPKPPKAKATAVTSTIDLTAPLDLPVAGGLAALALSSCFSQDPLLSLAGRYNSYAYGLWSFPLYAALFYSAAWTLHGERLRRFLGLLLSVGAVTGAYGVLQVLGLDPFLHVALLTGGRAVSILGSPVDLGAYLILLLPLALHWTLAHGRVTGLLSLFAIGGGVIASGSRGAWIAGAAGALVYLGVAVKLQGRSGAGLGVGGARRARLGRPFRRLLSTRPAARRFGPRRGLEDSLGRFPAPALGAQPRSGRKAALLAAGALVFTSASVALAGRFLWAERSACASWPLGPAPPK